MDPNQNQPNPNQGQYSADYLNTIAPKPTREKLNPKLMLGLIGGVVLLVIIIFGFISTSSGGPTQKMRVLGERMITLQAIASKAQGTIKSGDLRNINGNFIITLANANKAINDPYAKNGVDLKKPDKAIKKQEDGTALKQRLEDARLSATYDRTYAREMIYQIDGLTILMKDIYKSSSSKVLKDFLTATDNNLQPIKKQFTDFKPE